MSDNCSCYVTLQTRCAADRRVRVHGALQRNGRPSGRLRDVRRQAERQREISVRVRCAEPVRLAAAERGGRVHQAVAGAPAMAETAEEKAAQVEGVDRHELLDAAEERRRFGRVQVARQRGVQGEKLRRVAQVLHAERDDRGRGLAPLRPGGGQPVRSPVPPGRARALS